MQAKDIMTVNVISVTEDTAVHEVVSLLLQHRISAVPVVDQDRKVIGIVSEGDLLRPEGDARSPLNRPWWLEAVFAGKTVDFEKSHGRTVGSVMTRNVFTVDPEMQATEIAGLLERHHIKRVPVVDGGKLVGIVSRANLLHGLAGAIVERHDPGAAKDREMRDKLQQMLLDEHELDTVLVNVMVSDGRVRLWGVVENAEEAEAAERAAKALPGVTQVENNLGRGPLTGVPV
ncbi:MAG: CBS domain-containing protein [Alphaproteobacteria bacterium]